MMLLKVCKHLCKRWPVLGSKRASHSSESRSRELTHHPQRSARSHSQDVARLKVKRTAELIADHCLKDLARTCTICEQGGQNRACTCPDINIKVVRRGAAGQLVERGQHSYLVQKASNAAARQHQSGLSPGSIGLRGCGRRHH